MRYEVSNRATRVSFRCALSVAAERTALTGRGISFYPILGVPVLPQSCSEKTSAAAAMAAAFVHKSTVVSVVYRWANVSL